MRRVRDLLAPLAAFLACCLLLCCLVTLPDVADGWASLSVTDPRIPGWAGVALVVAVATAALALFGQRRLGAGPPLALGATTALLGLALSGDVTAGGQAVLVLLLLALAVGGLFGGVLTMVDEVGPETARWTAVGWLVPWAAGWGVVGWLALRGRSGSETRLGLHPPALVLVVGAGLLLVWAVAALSLPVPRDRPRDPERPAWENAWAALGVLVLSAASVVMLVGFQDHLAASWGRPVVLLAAAGVAAGLVACALVVPDPAVWPAYVAVVVATALGPSCLHVLLLVTAEATGALSAWLVPALALAGLAGASAGWRVPRTGAPAGLVLMALAAAGGWVMPANQWLMLAAAAPFGLGLAAAGVAGLRLAGTSRMALRFVAVAGLGGLLLGLVAAAPIAWALGADVTGADDARAGGRVLLGLTFAATVVGAALCAVLLDRAGRTAPRQT